MRSNTSTFDSVIYVSKVFLCVLSLSLALGSASSGSTLARVEQEINKKYDSEQPQLPPPKNVAFKLTRMSDGKTPTGERSHTDSYVASDGNNVWVDFVRFDSALSARTAVQTATKDATKILDRRERPGKDGASLGVRVIAVFSPESSPASGSAQTLSALIWSDGPVLHEIRSVSLDDVLAMEKFLLKL
jgi:hypothetical protein